MIEHASTAEKVLMGVVGIYAVVSLAFDVRSLVKWWDKRQETKHYGDLVSREKVKELRSA